MIEGKKSSVQVGKKHLNPNKKNCYKMISYNFFVSLFPRIKIYLS